MSFKLRIFYIIIFAAFFVAGWYLGLSPLRQSIHNYFAGVTKLKNTLHTAFQVAVPEGYISDIQYKMDILHYTLKLDLYPDKQLIKGEAILKGIPEDKSLSRIDLNFYDNMTILSLTVNGKKTDYNSKGSRLEIYPGSSINDTFIVVVNYEGKPEREGLGSFTFGKKYGHNVIYNLSEPNYASTWFPCNDMPSDKAYLDIYLTNDTSMVSASNGILVNKTTDGSRRTYHWKTLYPISTYLVCLYSSVYKNFSDSYISQDKKDTMPIEYFAFPEDEANAKTDFGGHPGMIDFFSKTFGEYPFIKEKYGVAEFLWQLGAMEHQTLTGIGSNFVNGRRYFTDVYVHELAHQWFGDAVGPATWKDIWLNEGFATYCETLYSEHLAGGEALRSAMMSKFDENFSGSIYDPGSNLFSSLVYDKGAWVLHMLRWEIGDKAFFKTLSNYFEKFKYKTASTDDFKNVCEETSGKNLDQFFKQWIYEGNNVPKIDYGMEVNPVQDSNEVILKLRQVQAGYSNYDLPIQFLFRSESGKTQLESVRLNSLKQEFRFRLNFKPIQVIPDPDNWLLVYFKLSDSD
ncbi:MAG TPA: M1 family aminopeptidase [Ignavibacteriaceae bacterium]|nr:M1 family aminopeptidase [Ignavibacteriaceae bacterium]